MNLRFDELKCPCCRTLMQGAGGKFGGRLTYRNQVCPDCQTKLIIVPVNPEYDYKIQVSTEQEKKERDEKIFNLHQEISLIQEKIDAIHKLNNL